MMYLANKIFYFSIIIFLSTFSWTDENNQNQNHKLVDKEVINCVSGFFGWYKLNYRQVNSHTIIYTDSSTNFQVDTTACKNYLKSLKNSGYISNEYVKLWMQYFMSKAENFKINHQSEGPPEGFDMDLVLLSQEPELIFQSIKKLKYTVQEMSFDKGVVLVHTPYVDWKYVVELSKINKKWYIDYISLKEPE